MPSTKTPPAKQSNGKRRPVAVASSAVRLNLKVGAGADLSDTIAGLSKLPGVEEVVKMFPEEQDPELSRLYAVKVTPSKAASAHQLLQSTAGVEYVEPTAPRKLIW